LRIVKWLGVCLGAVVLLAAGLGVYLYLQIPKPVDPLPPLQTWLFEAPANHADQIAGRYVFRSAQELAELIRTRKATSEAVVAEHLAYIRAENHRLNALVWLRADEALAEARAADAAVASGAVLGPLHGVPITIKEMFGVRGLPETLNAKALTLIAREDAPLVAALRRAGAIVLGTTNVPYMLADYQTSGEIYPTGSNPYDVTRTPGGSTGGGAAAVAAGFSTLELGSDMGGSVRVPAAFCGLWALKATVGALNITQGTNPMPSLAFTRMALASPGLLARTAGDLALAWGALKTAPIDPAFQQPITWQPASAKSLGDYRLAWSDDWGSAHGPIPVSRSVRGRLQSFVTAVASQGAKVDRTSPPLYDDLLRNFLTSFSLMNAEGQPWLLRKLIAMDLRKLAPTAEMAQTIDRALADGSDAAWQAAQADRERLARAWDTFFRDHDLLISPITYGPAFTKTTTGAPLDGDDGPVPYLMYEAYAPVVNAVGFPTLSIPMGLDDRGLPIGLQVIGPRLSEEELLHFAALVEGLVGGYARPPAFGPRK
jgi:amidase